MVLSDGRHRGSSSDPFDQERNGPSWDLEFGLRIAIRLLPTYALDTRFERTDISAVAVEVMLQQGSEFRLGFKGSGLQNPGLRQTLIEDDTPLEERLGLLRARI